MEKLPAQTNKLLRKIDKIKSFDIKVSDISSLKMLDDLGYINIHSSLTIDKLRQNSNWMNYLTITTQGKLYLETYKNEEIKFWVPTLISIIALISSFREEILKLIQWLLD